MGLTSALVSGHPYKSSQPTSVGVSSNDFIVDGASVSSASGSGATYTVNLTPDTNPPVLKFGSCGAASSTANGERNQRSVKEILFRPPVVKEFNLAMWFPLVKRRMPPPFRTGPHGLVGSVAGNPPRYQVGRDQPSDFRKRQYVN